MKNNWKRIILLIICIVTAAGFLLYEGYSIIKKEYVRQANAVVTAHERVNFNLDMLKIGIMTEDVEMYKDNLLGLKEQKAIIESLYLVNEDEWEYLGALGEYIGLLDSKVELLKELQSVKVRLTEIRDKLNENYGDKDTISRDKLQEAKDKVLEYKLETNDYTNEKVQAAIKEVNEILAVVEEKAVALVDCIDTCYKNQINGINDELADSIKDFTDLSNRMNEDFEKEYDFEKMKNIKEYNKDGGKDE